MKKSLMLMFFAFMATCLAFSVGNAFADAYDYWTPERMEAAEAFPAPEAMAEESYAAPQHDATAVFYPPPMQRYTHQGKYTVYPLSTVVKLFVTLDLFGDGNPVDIACSGAVIDARAGGVGQNDVVATAAHCLNNGLPAPNNRYATNVLVCPSYNAGGPNAQVGCWAADSINVTIPWASGLGFPSKWEQDVGCIVAEDNNSHNLGHIGDAVGMLDVDYDRPSWDPAQPPFDPPPVYFNYSYPVVPPFPGYHIIASVGPQWYEIDYGGLPGVVKFMGGDATRGYDGGPWILGYEHRDFGYIDIDGRDVTDPLAAPARPALGGINSHRRPLGPILCPNPDFSFWCSQEIASPQITTFWTKPFFDRCQGLANVP